MHRLDAGSIGVLPAGAGTHAASPPGRMIQDPGAVATRDGLVRIRAVADRIAHRTAIHSHIAAGSPASESVILGTASRLTAADRRDSLHFVGSVCDARS